MPITFWIIIILFVFVAWSLRQLVLHWERSHVFAAYRKKERVLSNSEQDFFIKIEKILGAEYILLSKVRIEDFVMLGEKNIFNNHHRWGLRNRIKSRHVDFLICDTSTTKPLLAIELDGKSHLSFKQQKRDDFIDKLYQTIELPVKHVSVGSDFASEAENILNILKDKGSNKFVT